MKLELSETEAATVWHALKLYRDSSDRIESAIAQQVLEQLTPRKTEPSNPLEVVTAALHGHYGDLQKWATQAVVQTHLLRHNNTTGPENVVFKVNQLLERYDPMAELLPRLEQTER